MKKKILAAILCTTLVVATTVLGTLAYLTDRDSVVNTFTVGNVDIELDETKVDLNGTPVLDEEGEPVDRVKGNEYHLIPGQTYTKDPTITVDGKSEESYIRMMVTINCLRELDEIFASDGANLTEIFGGYDPATWIYIGENRDEAENTITYEFRYKETVTGNGEDQTLEALFTQFTLPGEITGEELKTIGNLAITVDGHAIQAAGFDSADAAWESFEKQISKN